MTMIPFQGTAQIVFYVLVLLAVTPLLGSYMARVYEGENVLLARWFGFAERGFYRLLRTSPDEEQDWKGYGTSVIVFSLLFIIPLYLLLRLQGHLPLNPDHLTGVNAGVSVNTAASFVTNTNWQYYGGESTMSYLSQMAGLAVQNFVSAAVGMAVLAAMIRGFARRETSNTRELLGRPVPHHRLHPAADLHRDGGRLSSGRAFPTPSRPRGRAHRPGPHPEHRPRARWRPRSR